MKQIKTPEKIKKILEEIRYKDLEYYYKNNIVGTNQRNVIRKVIREKGKPPIFEHRKVWEDNYGIIPKGFLIHHKNCDKKDNKITNLQLVSIKEHVEIHKKINRLNKRGQYSSKRIS